MAAKVGRPKIETVVQRVWMTRLDEQDGHLVWTGEGEVDRWKAPIAHQSTKRVNVRRELFKEAQKKQGDRKLLAPNQRLTVVCDEEKCCRPAHMRVVSASVAAKAQMAENAAGDYDTYRPWLNPGSIVGNRTRDFSAKGKIAFRLMKQLILDAFADWNEDSDLIDVERMREHENSILVLDLNGSNWSKVHYELISDSMWKDEDMELCFPGVLGEPLFQQKLDEAGVDFAATTLLNQMYDRLGSSWMVLMTDRIRGGEWDDWPVDLDPDDDADAREGDEEDDL